MNSLDFQMTCCNGTNQVNGVKCSAIYSHQKKIKILHFGQVYGIGHLPISLSQPDKLICFMALEMCHSSTPHLQHRMSHLITGLSCWNLHKENMWKQGCLVNTGSVQLWYFLLPWVELFYPVVEYISTAVKENKS